MDPKYLEKQNEQLKAQLIVSSLITEITKVMLSAPDLESVFRTMILGIKETLNFERLILFQVNSKNFSLKPKYWAGFDDSELKGLEISLSFLEGGEIPDAIFLNRAIIVDPVDKEADIMAGLKTKCYIAVPIISKAYATCYEYHKCTRTDCPCYQNPNPYCWSISGSGKRYEVGDEDKRRKKCVECPFFKGNYVVWMDKPSQKKLVTSEEVTVLTTLAKQAGIIVDNFETYESLEKANRDLYRVNKEIKKINQDLKMANLKISKDLEQARKIQLGLLPQTFPKTDRFSCAASYIPAERVGGDYYDIFQISKDSYCFLIADVSGHGMAAALIMSMVKMLIKTHATPSSAKTTLDKINEVIDEGVNTENFVTMFYGVINLKENKIIYSSAGHNPIILLDKTDRKIEQIRAEGIFLGVFDNAMLKDNYMDIKTNTRIVLYTDGLTEAENSLEEMYTYERLAEVSQKTSALTNEEAKEEIISDLKSHIKNVPVKDDITILIIDFK